MRTFVVVKEEYSGSFNAPGELTVNLVTASTLDELALQLDPKLTEGFGEGDKVPTPWAHLYEINGDGYDYYLINELVDGKLIEVLSGHET